MLIEFTAKNYKSYKDKIVFSMEAAQKIKEFSYSVFKINKNKVLPTAIIYGPNAAGKSNLIKALKFLKEILLRGDIDFYKITDNTTLHHIDLAPNMYSQNENSEFFIKFYEQGFLFEYFIEFYLGEFGTIQKDRKIVSEKLHINSELIFERSKNNLTFFTKGKSGDYILPADERFVKSIVLNSTEIFLKRFSVFSLKFSNIIFDWLINKLVVSLKPEDLTMTVSQTDRKILKYGYMDDVAKQCGLSGREIMVELDKDTKTYKLLSIVKINGRRVGIPSEDLESYGTNSILTLIPSLKTTMQRGGTFVIDEIDAIALHPRIIMSIINVFHNNEINTKQAQLIFTTHNPIFLDNTLYRRDEINFVDYNEETNSSEIYRLSDFGTQGAYGVRKTESYLKHYFLNKYGAIKDFDLSDIFINIMKEGGNANATNEE